MNLMKSQQWQKASEAAGPANHISWDNFIMPTAKGMKTHIGQDHEQQETQGYRYNTHIQ